MADPGVDSGRQLDDVRLVHKIGYALGGGGWVAVDRLLLTWGLYFYVPPGDRGFVQRLPDWSFLGVLTLWGLASVLGRVVDSVTDPLMASWTDKSRHPFGRRRVFMAAAALPLSLFTAAVFFPPDEAPTWANAGWAFFTLFGYFLAYTVYAVPYTALLAEIGRPPPVRLQLSTMQAAAQMATAGLVMVGAPAFFVFFDEGDPAVFHTIAVTFALLALVLMSGPVLLVDEPRLCDPGPVSTDSAFKSLFSTLSSVPLRWFLLATVAYWFGFNVVAQGVPYYVTVLMGQSEDYASKVLGVLFGVSFVAFFGLPRAAALLGKRRLMILGAASMAALMFILPFVRDPTLGLVFMGFAGVPVAIVMAVPNAILASLADEDARRTGLKREAMVFATQAFFLKVNLGLSTAVVAGLLPLGNTQENPLGVQLTGPVAGCILLVSAFAYWRFRDPETHPLS